jgi:hypothetical protein
MNADEAGVETRGMAQDWELLGHFFLNFNPDLAGFTRNWSKRGV